MAKRKTKAPAPDGTPHPETGALDAPAFKDAVAQLPPAHRAKLERFEAVEVHRSQLKNAPYNPRTIQPKNKAKLKKVIQKMGMISPVTWNRRSGNIVGGHQRIDILDALEGHADYRLTVAAVDLDDRAEREANVALNNSSSQGEYDLEKLRALFKDDQLEPEATGFDMAELYQMFGESPFAEQPKHLETLAKNLRDLRDQHEKFREAYVSRHDTDFYSVLVFRCYDDRKAFTDALGLEDNRYIDGRFLAERLKQQAPHEQPPGPAQEAPQADAQAGHEGRA